MLHILETEIDSKVNPKQLKNKNGIIDFLPKSIMYTYMYVLAKRVSKVRFVYQYKIKWVLIE